MQGGLTCSISGATALIYPKTGNPEHKSDVNKTKLMHYRENNYKNRNFYGGLVFSIVIRVTIFSDGLYQGFLPFSFSQRRLK